MTPMVWSEEGRPELFAAYVKAQAEMGDVIKKSSNPAFKSKYADLAAVTDAVIPAFNKNGLAVIQSPSFDGEIVSIETYIAHTGGGFMVSTLSMRPTKADPQGVGSALTYIRRYSLLALSGVAPEDDDGNAASGPGEPGKRFEGYGGRNQGAAVDAAMAAINGLNTKEEFRNWKSANQEMLAGLSAPETDTIIRHFNARLAKVREPEPEHA